jgi:hypothetical protein
MVDYNKSINRPFGDLKKLLLGIVISIIPLVNILFLGYLIKVAKSAMKNDMVLPEWDDLLGTAVIGIQFFLIEMVYFVPVFILGLIGVFTGLITMPSFTGLAVTAILAWILGAGITMIILLIIGLLFMLLSSVAILRFAESGNFGAAFEFGEVIAKATKGNYIGGWLIATSIAFVGGIILNIIPIVGWIAAYVLGVFIWTALGQVYSEA